MPNFYTSVFSLRAPNGTTVNLIHYGCYGESTFYDTRIDDNGEISICDAEPPATGDFKPSYGDYLSDFNGISINGTWTLLIYNQSAYYPGRISSWGLGFATTSAPTPAALSTIYPKDYNGDGTADIAIFRPSSGLSAIRNISRFYFGKAGDAPVPSDYRGDGTDVFGIYRATSGLWAIKGISRLYFGGSSDSPAPGDYNGDGTSDIAIYRDGLWAIRGTSRIYFGTNGDIPY